MTRVNQVVLTALRETLGQDGRPVSRQSVEKRRNRLQVIVHMPNDIATYIVAGREGIRLHKYLDTPTLEQVASFEGRLLAKEAGVEVPPKAGRGRAPRKAGTAAARELRIGDIKLPSRALSSKRIHEVGRMAEVYAKLYAFENSVREFLDGHLTAEYGTAEYGTAWWDDPKIVNTEIRRTVERNRKAEVEHRYHSARNARPIYYTNMGDLVYIANSEKGGKVFSKFFPPGNAWFKSIVDKIEQSRNVVAHMNPLARRDITRIEVNFEDWLDQTKGHEPPSVP